MGIGASIVLMALGAILIFAVEDGFDPRTAGIILVIAGAAGLVIARSVLATRTSRQRRP